MNETRTFSAFAGLQKIVSGDIETMLRCTKARMETGETEPVLIFEDQTGKQLDFDFRGTADEVVARLASHPHFRPQEPPRPARSGPGRPGLGVICREVSLLPRHWDWLSQQAGGSSATLRRLVDNERKRTAGADRERQAWDAAGKFMWAMAGNLPGFEEASRALYAKDVPQFENMIRDWPKDLRDHLLCLVQEALRLKEEETASSGNAG